MVFMATIFIKKLMFAHKAMKKKKKKTLFYGRDRPKFSILAVFFLCWLFFQIL